ncbi:MAG: hypothetical protein IT422_12660 [Pirellulaceae bacterium]|nr:hypothetical protein [Pirellulaceae bacterium]
MFDRPQLITRDDCYQLNVSADHAQKLADDLSAAGFDAKLLDGTFGYEDLNSDERWDVATIQMPTSTDKLKLRAFLREWAA